MRTRIGNKDIEVAWLATGYSEKFRFFHLSPTILIHRDCRYNYGGIMVGWLYWGFEVKWSNHR